MHIPHLMRCTKDLDRVWKNVVMKSKARRSAEKMTTKDDEIKCASRGGRGRGAYLYVVMLTFIYISAILLYSISPDQSIHAYFVRIANSDLNILK